MPRTQVSTAIESDLVRELKVCAAENNWKMNDIIESALHLWLAIEKDKDWNEIADCIPGSKKGNKLSSMAYDLGA
jgi:hypothetical protein